MNQLILFLVKGLLKAPDTKHCCENLPYLSFFNKYLYSAYHVSVIDLRLPIHVLTNLIPITTL